MGNRHFQEARESVQLAKTASSEEREAFAQRAKNALSSAYANSTPAEQRQLSELQNELENQ